MDFEQLKGFYYTAKFSSFTEAAKRLYLTQPAVSLKVKALEEAVGERLFERVAKRIHLTPAGKVLYERTEELIAKLDDIVQVVRDLKSLEHGRLVVGASDTTSIYFLPELLREYRNRYPKIDLSIESVYSSEVVEKVLDREVDLGVVTLPQKEERLSKEPLFSQKFVCAVPPGHRFCQQKTVQPADIAREPLVLLDGKSHTRCQIDAYLRTNKTSVRPVLELSSFEIIKSYVAAGHGISLLPDRSVAHGHPDLRVVRLARRLSVKIGIVYRRDRTLSHCARAFLEMVRAHFKRRPAGGANGRLAAGPA